MTRFQLAEHQGTRLWSGDVIVVGGTLGGLTAALAAAADGCRVCLLEPGPTLGTELSAEWDNDLPEHQVVSRLRTLVGQAGAPVEGPVDIVLGALACDQLVEEGSVDAFVKVIPARLLRDGDGRLEGVETVGKSGRQAVSAPVVIDATRDQRLARRELGLDPAVSEQVVRRLYVANLELPEEGACWTVPDSLGLAANRVQGRPGAWPGEALLEVVMRRGSATLSELMLNTLQAATDSFSWLRQNEPAFETATLVEVAPDFAERGVSRETLDVPEGTGLLVLERCEDVGSRLASGHAVGKGIGTPQRALPEAASAASADETVLKTAELSASEDQDFSAMTLPPVLAQGHHPRDVVVAGYGTGGAFAALAAAEEGVEVAVLDPSPIPGGIGSAGRIHSYYHGLKGGLQDRLDEQVTGQRSALGPKVRGYQPVARAAVLAGAMGDRQGLDIYAGHTVFGVVRESGRITGVVSVAADGYHVFPCTVAVDGTGDGDVAAAAGAPTTLGREGDGFPQPYSYTPTSVNGTELRHHNFDAGWVDPTDTADFSRAHFEGRRAIRERGPFSPETHFCSLATILGLRESRFLEGRLTLTFEDFLNGKTFPDTVCSAYAHHDNHAMDYAEESEWSRRHVVMFGLWRYLCHGDIPYRALLPQEVDGLLMACRALSVDHDLHQLVRMQRDMQVIGEICGVAAAESVKRGTPPRICPSMTCSAC